MRAYLSACLSALVPTRTAAAPPDRNDAALSRLAGTGVRLFDPNRAGVGTEFLRFLTRVRMQNGRPLPDKLISDTAAALAVYRGDSRTPRPAYFVATNFDKTVASVLSPCQSRAVRKRYGEDIFPPQCCPVFASHAGAAPSRLLSEASGLPAALFAGAPGRRDNYHRLFLLTEVSHCGFLTRPALIRGVGTGTRSSNDVRAIVEAVGDFEASVVFHNGRPQGGGANEADALFAARTLAMFLCGGLSAYSTIPGLSIEFAESGVVPGSARLEAVKSRVIAARRQFRRIIGPRLKKPGNLQQLDAAANRIRRALDAGTATGAPAPVVGLLELFPKAVEVLAGRAEGGMGRFRGDRLMTLPGAEGTEMPAAPPQAMAAAR